MKRLSYITGSRLLTADLILIALSVIGSFALRLNLEQLILDFIPATFVMLITALAVKPLVYRRLGLYQRVWAYASIEEMKLIIRTVSIASAILSIIVLSLHFFGLFARLPRSVLVIDWLASLAAVGALRFGLRLLADNTPSITQRISSQARRLLVVGAGDAGALVVREMQKNPQSGLVPVGYLDDDLAKLGHQIHGIPVIGALSDLPEKVSSEKIDEVIIALPSAPGQVLRKVTEMCRAAEIPFRTMPGIYELIGGSVSVNRLRPVNITDLLRRQPVTIDRIRVGETFRGQSILVTGAGGSIASELCRQVARWNPKEIVLLGHGENSIFDILLELANDFPKLEVHPVIADIRDKSRLVSVLQEFQPTMVFHAAAHKHVPLMERNPTEAITNNVLGTQNVVQTALNLGVKRFVMISTDKAVRPVSVMGASKRIAEWIVLDAARKAEQSFSVVRFGNVLGSRGSVIPLFEKQIASGGPVTVHHPEVERFFMTIPEAVHLVLQASTFESKAQMYMLNMGDPVRIADLAEDLIRLSGLEPGEDIEIEFNGLRPGDKLSEELWEPDAQYEVTEHPDIYRVAEKAGLSGNALSSAVKKLIKLAEKGQRGPLVAELGQLLPSSQISSKPPKELTSLV